MRRGLSSAALDEGGFDDLRTTPRREVDVDRPVADEGVSGGGGYGFECLRVATMIADYPF